MLRKVLRLAAGISLLLPVLLLPATPPPERRCPPPPDGSSLICRARCMSGAMGSFCETNVQPQPPVTAYCLQVRLIGEVPDTICHEGEYDRCCDPNAEF